MEINLLSVSLIANIFCPFGRLFLHSQDWIGYSIYDFWQFNHAVIPWYLGRKFVQRPLADTKIFWYSSPIYKMTWTQSYISLDMDPARYWRPALLCPSVTLFIFNCSVSFTLPSVWMSISLPRFRKISDIIVLNVLSVSFFSWNVHNSLLFLFILSC